MKKNKWAILDFNELEVYNPKRAFFSVRKLHKNYSKDQKMKSTSKGSGNDSEISVWNHEQVSDYFQ